MPSLGADMAAGTLVEWLKKPGDLVQRGDIIAVVETDKGAIEVEIFEGGRLDRLLVGPGQTVPVGTALAIIAGDEAAPEIAADVTAPPAPAPQPVAATIDVMALVAGEPGARPRASPAARKLAAELGMALTGIAGTGPAGSIVVEDVRRVPGRPPRRPGVDLNEMRRAIAAAMARSKRDIPHYYLAHGFDVTSAQDWLSRYNAERPPDERLLLGALLLKAVALAVRDFPEFNGFHVPDGFRPSAAIHVGTAIAIRGGGLAAPALHETDQLALGELMRRLRDLIGRVRRGTFRSSELSDPTITVSSLGERGVEAMLPIIYPPQVAIIGFGAVVPRPWIVDGRVEARAVITVTLAADHRVSDGHRGALLLQRVEALLARPEAL